MDWSINMNKESFKKRGAGLALIIGVIAVSFILLVQYSPRLVTDKETGFSYIAWGDNMVSATEYAPVNTNAGCILEIYFFNHSATPTTTYGTNHNSSLQFESWCNGTGGVDPDGSGTVYKAYVNSFSGTWPTFTFTTLTLKWNVNMDMLIRYRGNQSQAANGTMFNAANCRIKVNATGGGCANLNNSGSGTILSQVVSRNATGLTNTFIWINAYYNIGTLNKGGTYTIWNIKLSFNY